MASLQVTVDETQIARIANTLQAIGKASGPAIAKAINHVGDKARTQMIRAVTVQTGLKRGVIVRALRVTKATGSGSSSYTIRSSGGNVSLKYFGARETAAGVSAAPRGVRQVFAGSFMNAGWWPHRVVKPNWNGQVFRRAGGLTKYGKAKFTKVKSGVFIPEEMVTGASADAFRAVVDRDLPDRLTHELLRAIAGA